MDGAVEQVGQWYKEPQGRHLVQVEYPFGCAEPGIGEAVKEMVVGFVSEFGDELGIESAEIVISDDTLHVIAIVSGIFTDAEYVVPNMTDLLASFGIEPRFGKPSYRVSEAPPLPENQNTNATLES